MGPETARRASAPREQARKRPKELRKSKVAAWTGGPTSSAANTIPLKRRRLPEQTPTPKEPTLPVLTEQGLQSRMYFQEGQVDRVAAFCDYLSIARPKYTVVDERPSGVHFAAQFPATEIFLNRVGRIGLTGPVSRLENGKEICAGNVEAFLMEQVENGTVELHEEEESDDAHSAIANIAAVEELPKRTKKFRIDDNAARFSDNVNRYLNAKEVTLKMSRALTPSGRPWSPTAAGQPKPVKTGLLVSRAESTNHQPPSCVVDQDERPVIIKQEPIEQQLGLSVDEYKNWNRSA